MEDLNNGVHSEKYVTQKGITLIALIITIIVMLILVAVSINIAIRNNLFQEAKYAVRKTEDERVEEQNIGNGIIKIGNKEYIIQEDGTLKEKVDNELVYDKSITDPEGAIPTNGTITQNDVTKGIIMVDSNKNEWAWVVVPKTIYTDQTYNNGTSPAEAETTALSEGKTAEQALQIKLNKIEDIMKKYTISYRSDNFKDIWYGSPIMDENYNFSSVNANIEGLTEQQKADDSGCGLTYNDYYTLKNQMLQSVYNNGGFWVGRYEVGIDEDTLVIQQNKYLYNELSTTVSKAQKEIGELATGGKTCSLMFGIQWDLMLKYIEEKGYLTNSDGTINKDRKITSDMLKGENSKLFGNTWDAQFIVNRGEYYTLNDEKWTSIEVDNESHIVDKEKKANGYILLTTGAAEVNQVLGIYDFVGNLQEMTLEFSSESDSHPVTICGGNFYNFATDLPASGNAITGIQSGDTSYGIRPALY